MSTHSHEPLLPSGAHRWNRALLGAFKKGISAQQAGLDLDSCPYEDKRKASGRLTWSPTSEQPLRHSITNGLHFEHPKFDISVTSLRYIWFNCPQWFKATGSTCGLWTSKVKPLFMTA